MQKGQPSILTQSIRRYGRQIPFAYLLNIKDEFLAKFASRAKGQPENGLDKIFGCGPVLIGDMAAQNPLSATLLIAASSYFVS